MPAHRPHATASARAAGTPARRDSHHRIRSFELTHALKHVWITVQTATAKSCD